MYCVFDFWNKIMWHEKQKFNFFHQMDEFEQEVVHI